MKGDILKIRIQDYVGNRTLFKNECNLASDQEVMLLFSSLLSFGVDVRKIARDLDKFLMKEELDEVRKRIEEEEGAWFK